MTIGSRQRENELLSLIRSGSSMTRRQQLELIIRLSIPSMLAQLSVIVMMYIDASMVGSLGANASASIGLVSTTTWLFGGIISSAATGFSVQVAHKIGAGDFKGARDVLRQSFVAVMFFGIACSLIGVGISSYLPLWLGGNEEITGNASRYFFIYALSLPFLQLMYLSGAMLRSSGNMRIPSIMSVIMCVLDVAFNFFLIFPRRGLNVFGWTFYLPGGGLGIVGAALGTACAIIVIAVAITIYLCVKSPELALNKESGRFMPTVGCLSRAFRISFPLGCEHTVICGAQIMTTVIIAPLGAVAIAANSFAITAESLCYMPGYGISEAATTLIGQSKGAGRKGLMHTFARQSVFLGMAVMAFMGVVMYLAAPLMIEIMTPVIDIRELGTSILRIEAFAEPMFAASIVAYGAFIGAGDTIMPSCMNFFSIWVVRITLAALLAPIWGLWGVWLAMCVELCFRGAIFLIRLFFGKWTDTMRVGITK